MKWLRLHSWSLPTTIWATVMKKQMRNIEAPHDDRSIADGQNSSSKHLGRVQNQRRILIGGRREACVVNEGRLDTQHHFYAVFYNTTVISDHIFCESSSDSGRQYDHDYALFLHDHHPPFNSLRTCFSTMQDSRSDASRIRYLNSRKRELCYSFGIFLITAISKRGQGIGRFDGWKNGGLQDELLFDVSTADI